MAVNSDEQIELALERHQAGDLGGAEKIYRQILDREPNHGDALHFLGVVAGQRGKFDEAVDLVGRATRVKPDDPDAWRTLAALLADRGRFDEAIVHYRKALELLGDEAEIHRDLGSVLAAGGQLDAAAESLEKAIQLNPNDARAHNELGSVRTRQNRFEEAIAECSQAIAVQSGFSEAHRNLGDALRGKGMATEALAAYSRAIELKPDFARAHFDVAEVHRLGGRIDEALAAYRRALHFKPDYFEALNNLGNLLRDSGKLDEATAAYLKAAALQPGNPTPQFNLGTLYSAMGRLEEALAAYGRAAAAKADLADAHANMAMLLAQLQRFEEARACHAKAAALKPQAATTHQAMGQILLQQHDAAAAVEHFRRAAAADPKLVVAWNELGVALSALGKFDEAAGCFRKALELQPNSGSAYNYLLSTGQAESSADEVGPLRARLNQPNLSEEDRTGLEFALGKALDDLDRYDEAFACFAEANAREKRLRALTGERYDPAAMHRQIDELIQAYTPSFFEKRREWGEASEIPVFVVGMPRSGTTLAQQIAASHPQAYGAGELKDIGMLAKSLRGTGAGGAAMGADRDAIKKAATQHLQRLREMNATASRIVDKMPANIVHLGLIAVMFPRARVVLCRRDARDTCLSCFFQWFRGGNAFSFDLAHCGHRHREIDRLAAHWRSVLPLEMMELQYEDVVADLEGQSRRLIEFLGLAWDPACLQFYRAQNTVLTSSDWQVRQPIYTRSAGRWRHYERHLGPLLESLGA
jgi:tetratricopeptide (TPR) repeat protein